MKGAGYDSRPYRFHALLSTTKIFELDAKPTQEHKLACLRQQNIPIHQNISFIPMNFETDDLITTLCRHGYDRQKQTLFIWEGVTFYLSQTTVRRMLQVLRENSGVGSRVCFDFQTIRDERDLIQTGLVDETIKFGIPSENIARFINEHQYRIVEHVTADEMERRFLTLQNGDLFGKIMPMMNFLLIEHD
ncbi:methyltransferase, putative [Candidatus Moduliflexus flocculans]|uniref:S-adenosyl-L-methionine-dependent methyltransferase n=1 Tax=Candidatus Moduliflexus flocculans TaxID=1499966 RepID=A0A0S6W0Q5_9BACT|nr:methyltransferase, putative [Candidatus Moduliflexus flocculans]